MRFNHEFDRTNYGLLKLHHCCPCGTQISLRALLRDLHGPNQWHQLSRHQLVLAPAHKVDTNNNIMIPSPVCVMTAIHPILPKLSGSGQPSSGTTYDGHVLSCVQIYNIWIVVSRLLCRRVDFASPSKTKR